MAGPIDCRFEPASPEPPHMKAKNFAALGETLVLAKH
jgi:hypothetical protein